MKYNLPPTHFIDANIFLRFLVFDEINPHLSQKSRKIIQKIVDSKLTVFTNVLIMAEIVYVLEKYYKYSKQDVAKKLQKLFSLEGIIMGNKEKALASLSLYEQKNIDFEDAYAYLDMLAHDISKVITFDKKHFSRLEGIEIQ